MDGRDHRLSIALVLGGGAARGLAHIGVLEVIEREGITPGCIVGSSMGGLIGALSATGLPAREIFDVAGGFTFPRWFVLGATVAWDTVFKPAVPLLLGTTFQQLSTPLVVTAVDIEARSQVLLDTGPILPAVRATCAVPGVLPAVRVESRWLVDGGLLNVLPVDVAWMAEPDIVIAVNVGATRARRMPQMGSKMTSLASRLGTLVQNVFTARVAFDMLVRAAEIVLDRQTMLAAAMTDREVLIEPDTADIGLRDFHRRDEAVEAGRRAAKKALPKIRHVLEHYPPSTTRGRKGASLRIDPVCAMLITSDRARAAVEHQEVTYYFCSANCHDRFVRDPERYRGGGAVTFAATRPGRKKRRG